MPPTPVVPLLRWDAGTSSGVDVAVTTRVGGVSAPPYDTLNLALHVGDQAEHVAVNRTRAAAAFGVGLGDMVFARQVHGAKVASVGTGDRGRGTAREDDAVPGADVLVTTQSDVTLVIMVADCVPLALVDSDAGVLGVVHAGWRGTAAGVVAAALAAMDAHGARRERVRAFLGPAVPPDRYQVDDEVRDRLAGAVAGELDPGVATRDGPGHWRVDLVAANRQHLLRSGVPRPHITACGATTADEPFFSDRAQRPCGRFALLARLTG